MKLPDDLTEIDTSDLREMYLIKGDRIQALDERIAELEQMLARIVEFHNMPVEAKRPDIWQLIINRAAMVLGK